MSMMIHFLRAIPKSTVGDSYMRSQFFRKRLSCLLILCLGGGEAVGQSAYNGSEAAKPASGTLLKSERDQLLAKISDLQAQIDALRKQIGMERPVETETAVPPISPDDSAKVQVPRKEVMDSSSQTSPGRIRPGQISVLKDRVNIGGYGSVRFEANDVGGDFFVPGGSARGFTFRRFVLTTDTHLSDRLRIHTETEF